MYEKDIWELFDELWEFVSGERPRVLVSRTFKPPMNFYETENEFVIQVALPGANKEEIRVEFNKGYLFIRGLRKDYCEDEPRQYHVLEIMFGPFERRIYIGENVDMERAHTTYKDGLLEIRIPKKIKKEVEIEIEIEGEE
jgi:HSP20 family protein